ncbi:uncharacterized protein At4g00950 isoform X1 [Amaranthus tricolor]|uniref:uncharacterized protein At4g00950 isoform X1 n=1 Tax=Amaranthus tricolor TaxID=29722 RepID=UPI002586926C|nr:uncharacterized protein At4g00950 isoform X1 [Amaranthus tricolor]
MGSEPESDEKNSIIPSTIPKLPLFSLQSSKSPQHSGNLTSPLHTSASVPFKWEEHPGKPLPCLTLALPSENTPIKTLELPPRLLNETKFTKTPSPTTVLEGPYNIGKSSSFRFLRRRQGSFDGSGALSFGGSGGSSPDKGLLGTIVLSRSSSSRRDHKGLFGSWRKKSGCNFKTNNNKHNDTHGGNFVFPSFLSDDGNNTNATCCDGGAATVKVKKPNLLGLSPVKSHFWAAIYGAFKQVVPSPRRSTKWKKDAW